MGAYDEVVKDFDETDRAIHVFTFGNTCHVAHVDEDSVKQKHFMNPDEVGNKRL